MPILQISFHYNFFSIDFKNILLKKKLELSVYLEREKEYRKKNQLLSLFNLQTRS